MPKILVVDDEVEIVEGTKRILEKRGYTVCTALDGKQGLEVALSEHPDLILTDVIMPVMDGFAFYKELKSMKITSKIPVLIVTARGPMEDTFKVIGADGFISKPFMPDDLVKEIEHILNIEQHKNFGERDGQPLEIKKILFVAKEQFVLEEAKSEAHKAGYDIDITLKGAESVTKVVQSPPDIVFIDVQIGDIPVEDIVDSLRHLPKFGDRPIIGYCYYKTEELGDNAQREKILNIKEASEKFLEAGGTEYMGRFNSHNYVALLIQILGEVN